MLFFSDFLICHQATFTGHNTFSSSGVSIGLNGTSLMFMWCKAENEDMPVCMFNFNLRTQTHLYIPLCKRLLAAALAVDETRSQLVE